MHIRTLFLTALLILCTASTAFAQRGDVLRELVPPPKMLLQHQDALQLTDKQKEQLKALIKDAHDRSLDLEFEVQEEAEKLAKMLSADQVDVSAALKQADRLMAVETRLKKVRLEMMIKTKNLLTAEQLEKIDEYRAKQRDQRRDRRREFRKRR